MKFSVTQVPAMCLEFVGSSYNYLVLKLVGLPYMWLITPVKKFLSPFPTLGIRDQSNILGFDMHTFCLFVLSWMSMRGCYLKDTNCLF